MKKTAYTSMAILTIFIIILTSPVYSRLSENDGIGQSALIPRPEPVKPEKINISPGAEIVRVIVKFREASDVRLRGNQLVSLKGQSLSEVNGLLQPYRNERIKRLIDKPEIELTRDKYVYELRSGHQLADFNLYYTLEIRDPSEAEAIINRLNRLEIVEIAYIDPQPEPAGDIDPPTPDYTPHQDYLLAAPTGVDAVYSKTLPGGDGTGVKIIDIENNWNDTHEDLEKALGAVIGLGANQDGDHGTAVIGAMIAGDNGYGVTGICPGADIAMVSAGFNGTVNAMLIAIDNLDAGDLMLIELHSPGPRYDFQVRTDQLGYVCMEYWQDRFDALQYAWAKGIIVIEAAGNGAENLDDVIYEQRFDTTYRNSHAIMAGAGAPPSGNHGLDRSRLDFSNYGSRVNLQGYGREVFTTGYGSYWDGDGDPNQWYTATFSGTSSASPIVTGAVACLQGYYEDIYGVPFDADYARELFNATGTPQQGNITEHIGPRPDLAAASAAITAPPSLYTDPIYIDTSMVEGTTADFSVWLINRASGYGLDFTVTGNDSLLKIADWLNVSPGSGLVSANDSTLLTVTIDASVLEDRLDIYKGIVEINWGVTGGAQDSSAVIPVFLAVPCLPETTYTIASDNDPEGHEFNWVEIKDIGFMISPEAYYNNYAGQPLDDGSAGPYALPFDFPFYDSSITYNRIYVGVNGAISFTDIDVNGSGYYEDFDMPGNTFSTVLSPFWNDLLMGDVHGAHGAIYYYFSPGDDTMIVEWWQMGNYNAADDTLTTFQVIMTENGNITFQYLDVGYTGLNSTAVIGIAAEGCTATPYFDHGEPAGNIVSNGSAIKFAVAVDPVQSGDANGDTNINILDITHIINYLYRSGPAPEPIEAGDPDCSGGVNLLDITTIINYLYRDGPEPCFYQP